VEKKGYMSRGGGGERLHVWRRWRRKATYIEEVEKKGYMSRGGGGEGYVYKGVGEEWLHV